MLEKPSKRKMSSSLSCPRSKQKESIAASGTFPSLIASKRDEARRRWPQKPQIGLLSIQSFFVLLSWSTSLGGRQKCCYGGMRTSHKKHRLESLLFSLEWNGPPPPSVTAAIDSALSSSCLTLFPLSPATHRSYSAVDVNPDLCKEQKNSALRKREEKRREREREREACRLEIDESRRPLLPQRACLPPCQLN